MFWISGVWDATMKHRVIGFTGIMLLFLVAYLGAVASGSPFIVRLIF